ncbi:hypothetical protein EV643_1273 [Kribbella sp. VKM Ac-2527]|uniref:Uncharacterized protein n=1 Tax=Kribbella caucasensis TaxID=2512215 RepID=A0A4R6JEM6_9ACTN|nr:hypothetical protein [Kribbella sp. VKM Ac-2527]TDO34309.1 hypothetical protein EV643_1273 [Kribbella sp. VKM Ac-2527]
MNDPTETLLAQSLANHATEAPSDTSLLADVHTRLGRRRRARTAGAAVLACAAVATAITGINNLTNEVAPSPAPATVAQPAKGWHWESYSNIQIQVPDSWQDGTFSHLWTCRGGKPAGPTVGRPTTGIVPMMACGSLAPPVAERVSHAFFDYNLQPGVFARGNGWTEEAKVFGAVGVSVFTDDDAVRRQIIDSAQLITGTDAYGCAPSSPAVGNTRWRPETGDGVAAMGEVKSIQICAYRGTTSANQPPPLVASAQLTGDDARAVGEALREAPEIPDRGVFSGNVTAAEGCQVSDSEILVLRLRGDSGEQEVVSRFAQCGATGFDDGLMVRQLTKPVLKPVVDAINRPEFIPPALQHLLR